MKTRFHFKTARFWQVIYLIVGTLLISGCEKPPEPAQKEQNSPAVAEVPLETMLEKFQRDLQKTAYQSMKADESADACRKFIAEQLTIFQQQPSFTAQHVLLTRICAFNTIWDASVRYIQLGVAPDKDREAIKPFIEYCKEIQTDAVVQRDLLLVAAAKGDAGRVKWLLDNGANVNVKNESGFAALTFAIQTDEGGYAAKTVEILLNAGADYDSKQGPLGMTPTMNAARLGNVAILKLILAKKPDVNVVGTAGQTALRLARSENHSEAVVLLKEAGAQE